MKTDEEDHKFDFEYFELCCFIVIPIIKIANDIYLYFTSPAFKGLFYEKRTKIIIKQHVFVHTVRLNNSLIPRSLYPNLVLSPSTRYWSAEVALRKSTSYVTGLERILILILLTVHITVYIPIL